MHIGLTGGGSTLEKVIEQARDAEERGFTALWYASSVLRDPLTAMAIAGRETTRIELGTAVLQTYPCHPILQANRAAAAAEAMGRPGFTLGLGPSHAPLIRDAFGLSYDRPGLNTEEYLCIVTELLRGNAVDFTGREWSAHVPAAPSTFEVPVLVSALSPRMLRIAGQYADGTILWMASALAIEKHVAPRIHAAAASAGRLAPRIVAGLPVAVHHDETEARSAVAATATRYEAMPNYRRIIEAGGGSSPADVAVVGDERSVQRQLEQLVEAGATDIWAQPVAVGDDRPARTASRERTLNLLSQLTTARRAA